MSWINQPPLIERPYTEPPTVSFTRNEHGEAVLDIAIDGDGPVARLHGDWAPAKRFGWLCHNGAQFHVDDNDVLHAWRVPHAMDGQIIYETVPHGAGHYGA